MNRRKNTLGILPLLATVLLSAASCTESVVQDMETAGDSGAIRFSLPTLTRSAIGSADDLNTDGRVVQRVGQLPPHQRHGQRRADIRQHDRDLRFRYRLDLRRRPAVRGSRATPTTSTPSIRPPERWAMPCPSPARTAPLPSRTSSPRKGTT
ncbi:hypothetical protein NXX09_12940 [Bacteroides uniformis]|nr:hypothetical protein [Bacteroides uniformis]